MNIYVYVCGCGVSRLRMLQKFVYINIRNVENFVFRSGAVHRGAHQRGPIELINLIFVRLFVTQQKRSEFRLANSSRQSMLARYLPHHSSLSLQIPRCARCSEEKTSHLASEIKSWRNTLLALTVYIKIQRVFPTFIQCN